MFDAFRIKLGDYVETRDGRIGYVTEAKPNGNTCFNWKMIDGTDMYTGKFDEEEKKDKCEIEQLDCKDIGHGGYIIPHPYDVAQKINEIIDYLNEGRYNNGTK